MKNKIILHLSVVCMLVTSSCYKREQWGVRGKGETVNEKRSVTSFNSIRLECSADVIFTQDSVYSVEVSGQKNILDILETKVSGSELAVDFTRNVWDYKGVKVFVRGPRISALSVSGSGEIASPGGIQAEHISLNISGSGRISLPSTEAGHVSVHISGSGSADLPGGNAGSSFFDISGSGRIGAEFLETARNTTRISGSGNATVFATETLDVNISGSGNVSYRGNPVVNAVITGSGKLRRI